jgi:hypothetical protein
LKVKSKKNKKINNDIVQLREGFEKRVVWFRKTLEEYSIDFIHSRVKELIDTYWITKEEVCYEGITNKESWWKIKINLWEYGSVSVRRMMIYYFLGTECISSWKKASKYKFNVWVSWDKHLDLFTDTWEILTIDHIIPKAKWGHWWIDNLQVMIAEVNYEKWANI